MSGEQNVRCVRFYVPSNTQKGTVVFSHLPVGFHDFSEGGKRAGRRAASALPVFGEGELGRLRLVFQKKWVATQLIKGAKPLLRSLLQCGLAVSKPTCY